MIELGDRQGWGVPGFAAIGADIHAAVVGIDHAPRVFGVNPQIVVVAVVGAIDPAKRFAAIHASEQWHLRTPDNIRVGWIHRECGVVPGALADGALVVDLDP